MTTWCVSNAANSLGQLTLIAVGAKPARNQQRSLIGKTASSSTIRPHVSPVFRKAVLPAPGHKRMTHRRPNEHRNNNETNNSTSRREKRSRRNSGRRASTSNCNRESISAAAFQNSTLATKPALVTTGAWPRTAARPMPLRSSPSIARNTRGESLNQVEIRLNFSG